MNRINDIARYAEGLMEADEQAAFDKELTADASLQQQLALYREVHGALALQFTMNDLRGEFFTAKPKVRYLWRAVAVAATLIMALFIWQPWKNDLYKDYSETTMVAPVERGSNNDQLLQDAANAFNKKDFTTAAKLLQQQDTTNSLAQFYLGVSLLQTDKTAEARSIFGKLYAGESAFKYEAAFYQALSYLKEKNNKEAITWLQRIPSDAPNHHKAKELLDKLQ